MLIVLLLAFAIVSREPLEVKANTSQVSHHLNAPKEITQLINTELQFSQQVSEHSEGIVDFLLLIMKGVLSVAFVVAVIYGMYALFVRFLDEITRR